MVSDGAKRYVKIEQLWPCQTTSTASPIVLCFTRLLTLLRFYDNLLYTFSLRLDAEEFITGPDMDG